MGNSLSLRLVGGFLVLFVITSDAYAQFDRKWLAAGSLHNWYSEVGSETESSGFVGTQQDGMRWPGVYRFTDTQAWKGLWIGARNVVDEAGTQYPYRVVHAGPRVRGTGEFFPVGFELVTRYPLPEVYVDGELAESRAPMVVERADENLVADAMIVNTVNTLLGLTMERRVLQFSQGFHDNYHVIEYTLTNTGNSDGDAEIELPGQTLTDVYFFPQWRWAVAKEARYVIGNQTGWGLNTMVDIWGDGVNDNFPGAEPVRAHYAWHGYFPAKRVSYNNIGGPILPQALPAEQIVASDTLGRLAAYQFVGAATLHADVSSTDEANDPTQPRTTTWIDSDAPFQSNNDAFNPARMESEYGVMSGGQKTPSHAYTAEPAGLTGWINGTSNPAVNGSTGGFSAASGYGPYTIAPGESVRIVIAEAVDGLSREAADAIGRAYKQSGASEAAPITYDGRSMTKNQWVFTGRDSLYQTFLRAQANYDADYAIPLPPQPPSVFEVIGSGDRIQLAWEYPDGAPAPAGFEIYRARGSFDSTYTLIHTAGPSDREYADTDPERGLDYYYYILAVGDASANPGGAGTPAGVALRSSRYYTQTYAPAQLKRPPGEAMADIRVVPNPYHIGSAQSFRFNDPREVHRLAFLNIPAQCRIDIYTEIGELVDTIMHTNNTGDEFWDHTTSSRQTVASGVYVAVFTNLENGEKAFRHFVVIR